MSAIALDRHGMDLANPDSIRRTVREIKPTLVVNAVAYTAVDKAESEPDYDALKDVDAMILLTEWMPFRHPDFDRIKTLLKQPVIFDGRNQ